MAVGTERSEHVTYSASTVTVTVRNVSTVKSIGGAGPDPLAIWQAPERQACHRNHDLLFPAWHDAHRPRRNKLI